MRRINKKCTKATAYKQSLAAIGGDHPSYNSSFFRTQFYSDVKANLICCQDGLCAYTEIRLDISKHFSVSSVWQNGRYTGGKGMFGQLDHFDPLLKSNKGWLWENFFLCHSDINNVKSDDPVHTFMKPDLKKYSPNKYLDYNYQLHLFTVSPKIKDSRKIKKIKEMIEVLGLNYGPVQRLRSDKLNDIFEDFHRKTKTLNQLNTDAFFTAFSMIKKKLA